MAKTKKPTTIKKAEKVKLISALDPTIVQGVNAFQSPYDSKKDVNWDKTTKWKVTTEGKRGFIILRYVRLDNGKLIKERLDRNLYKQDSTEVEEICRLLNHRADSRRESREAWIVKSTFIKDQGAELSRKFEAYLFARSNNRKHAQACRRMVEMHFLNYFYHERSKPIYDYLEWVDLKTQSEYLEYLLTKKVKSSKMGVSILSAKTVKAVIQYMNHFLKFLHIESKGHIPQLKMTFPTLTQTRLNNREIDRKKSLPKKKVFNPRSQYIDDATFKIIYKAAPDSIKSAIWIAYNYGLRRSEVLGLELNCIKKGYLEVKEQLLSVEIERGPDKKRLSIKAKTKGVLKSRKEEGRRVPHWFCNDLNKLYGQIKKLEIIHPSTLSSEWAGVMKKLDLHFTFHNLRNAFCSNALRDMNILKVSATDIQLAMGHTDLRTTMIYLRDYRDLGDDEVWTPEEDVG